MKAFLSGQIIKMLLLAGVFQVVHAQSDNQSVKPLADFPKQAITIISPFPPGGGNDSLSRLLAAELATIVGQTVVVENKAGAGGNVGTAQAARAKPDGYTILMSQTSIIAVNPVMYANAGFDPSKDFQPITQLTAAPVVFVVRAQSPYQSLSQYLEDARARPGMLNFATPGNGTLSHLTTTRLASVSKVQITHVPYRGAGPAITDLLGGQVDMVVTSPSSVEGLVSTGKLRVLAATNQNLIGVFKNTPTLGKLGIQNMEVVDWYGVFVPKATPPDRVQYLEKAIRQAMTSPALVAKVNQGGAEVVASDHKTFIKKVDQEIAEWSVVVSGSGIKAE